ncbi:MAG: V-type ATP synthase subunit E family protein [Oscillospiraceae bacterium]
MGAQQILDAIMHDADDDAGYTIASAKDTAGKILTKSVASAQSAAAEIEAAAKLEASETQKRRLLTAGIEARKNTLASKRDLIDRVFDRAKQDLCKLDGDVYRQLITKLVVNGAQSGDEKLMVPSDMRDRYAKSYFDGKTMLELLNSSLIAVGKKGELSLCGEDGRFVGGVRLIGKESDIDCSFGALIDAFRDEHETEVSNLLFKTED